MHPDMFSSIEEMSKATTVRKVNPNGEKFEWLKVQWLQFRKTDPMVVYYKYTVQEDVEFSSISFRKRSRPCAFPNNLTSLHPQQPRPLALEKLNDIRKLLKYVPPIHHPFFNALRSNDDAQSAVSNLSQNSEDDEIENEDVENVSPVSNETSIQNLRDTNRHSVGVPSQKKRVVKVKSRDARTMKVRQATILNML
jgi:hypothetical protein